MISDLHQSIVLRSQRLTVELAHPEAGLRSTRFDRSAWITQVRLDAEAGHPGHTFCVAESFVPGQGSGGAGLCGEFDLETPAGYAATHPGENFAKLGVGLLRRPDTAPYTCAQPHAVTRLFPVQVAVAKSEAVFTTEPLACGGIAARVVRTVSVRENELFLVTTLENVGQKQLLTREYCHNFVGFDKYPLGPAYRLQWNAPLTPLPAANAEAARVRENLILEGAAVRLRQTPQHPFYCQFTGARQSPEPQWELRHEPSGLGMSETVDFAPAHVALWGESHAISPEIFVAVTINPGETRHWSRHYRFHHGK